MMNLQKQAFLLLFLVSFVSLQAMENSSNENLKDEIMKEVINNNEKNEKIIEIEEKKEIDDCSICLENLDSENDIGTLFCGHTFHASCIFQWLEYSKKCPLCRTENPVVLSYEDIQLCEIVRTALKSCKKIDDVLEKHPAVCLPTRLKPLFSHLKKCLQQIKNWEGNSNKNWSTQIVIDDNINKLNINKIYSLRLEMVDMLYRDFELYMDKELLSKYYQNLHNDIDELMKYSDEKFVSHKQEWECVLLFPVFTYCVIKKIFEDVPKKYNSKQKLMPAQLTLILCYIIDDYSPLKILELLNLEDIQLLINQIEEILKYDQNELIQKHNKEFKDFLEKCIFIRDFELLEID